MKRAVLFMAVAVFLIIAAFWGYVKVDTMNGMKNLGNIKSQAIKYINASEGCTEKDYNIKVSYNFGRKPMGENPYVISAVFKDEKDVIYYYDIINNKILQTGVSPMKGKTDKNFKHGR